MNEATKRLEQFRRLFQCWAERDLTEAEIQRNKKRRGERIKAIIAATEAGRMKPDSSDVNGTFEA
jgi:hypothetical protein